MGKGFNLFIFASMLVLAGCMTTPTERELKPGEYPISFYFQNPRMSDAKLSPDGEFLAFIHPVEDLGTAAIYHPRTKRYLAAHHGTSNMDMTWVEWSENDYIVFGALREGNISGGLYAAPRQFNKRAKMLNYGDVLMLVDPLKDEADQVLVWVIDSASIYEEDGYLVKYDLQEGTGTKLNFRKPPGRILRWDTDGHGNLTTAYTYHDGQSRIMHLDSGTWTPVGFSDEVNLNEIVIRRYDPSIKAYWLTAYSGTNDTAGLYTFSPETGIVSEEIFRDEEADLHENLNLVYSRKQNGIVGIRYNTSKPESVWFHDEYREMQKAIDATFPDRINMITDFDEHERKVLVYSESDVSPGQYSLIDWQRKDVVFQDSVNRDLKHRKTHPMKVLRVKVRDGLKLEGYLTLPDERDKGPFPMITLVHGGPWARDTWGFNPEVQFLANRGYAVLQVNFRGSTGYGRSISLEHSGDFRAMVDDLSDATRIMVRSGIADPERLAIMGASFGGYASVASAAFDPDLYQCAISISGTFDMERQMKHWKNRFWKNRQGTAGYDSWVEKLGDPNKEKEYLESISPVYHADQIKIPLLLIHGKSDLITDDGQTKRLAKVMKKAGNKPETLYLNKEGHGFQQLERKLKVYGEIELFLEEHLGSME